MADLWRNRWGELELPYGWSTLPKVEKEELQKKYIKGAIESFEKKILDHTIKHTIIEKQGLDVDEHDPRWAKHKSGLLLWQDSDAPWVDRHRRVGFGPDLEDV